MYIEKDLPDLIRGDTGLITAETAPTADMLGKILTVTLKIDPNQPDPGSLQKKVNITQGMIDSGKLSVPIWPVETAELEPATHLYDMQIAGSAIDIKTIQGGRIRVRADITRSTWFDPIPDDSLVIVATYETTDFAVEAA